jgi:hypothetical protein
MRLTYDQIHSKLYEQQSIKTRSLPATYYAWTKIWHYNQACHCQNTPDSRAKINVELHTWFQASLRDPLMRLLLLLGNIRFQKLHIAATNLKAEKGFVEQMHPLHLTYHFSEDIFHLTLDDPTCKSSQTLQILFTNVSAQELNFLLSKVARQSNTTSLVLWVKTIKKAKRPVKHIFSFCFFPWDQNGLIHPLLLQTKVMPTGCVWTDWIRKEIRYNKLQDVWQSLLQ